MAGLYIHIPFCKKRCLYCDFFSTTALERQEEYTEAVLKEWEARKNEAGEPIETVYIGGGTPSSLKIRDLSRICQAITSDLVREWTLEVNAGDADLDYFRQLRQMGINRLSIGIQSFQDGLLRLIGRRHSAKEAIEAIRMAQKAGVDNISVDLMYALPTQTMEQWKADIETTLNLGIQHISCYGLMYEDGTALTRMVETGELEAIDEETENAMYDYLCARLNEAGFVHYEVSNFALPGFEAQHNSNYWNNTPYIGIGAGAHSYTRCDGKAVRSWNPSDLDTYIHGVLAQDLQRESETLTEANLYNEQIMLGLRTSKGCRLRPSVDRRETIGRLIENGLIRETDDGRIVATQKGLHILNRIIEDLMVEYENCKVKIER